MFSPNRISAVLAVCLMCGWAVSCGKGTVAPPGADRSRLTVAVSNRVAGIILRSALSPRWLSDEKIELLRGKEALSIPFRPKEACAAIVTASETNLAFVLTLVKPSIQEDSVSSNSVVGWDYGRLLKVALPTPHEPLAGVSVEDMPVKESLRSLGERSWISGLLAASPDGRSLRVRVARVVVKNDSYTKWDHVPMEYDTENYVLRATDSNCSQ